MSGARARTARAALSQTRCDGRAARRRSSDPFEHRIAWRKCHLDIGDFGGCRRRVRSGALTVAERRGDASTRRDGSGGEHIAAVREQHLHRELHRQFAAGKLVRTLSGRRRDRKLFDVSCHPERSERSERSRRATATRRPVGASTSRPSTSSGRCAQRDTGGYFAEAVGAGAGVTTTFAFMNAWYVHKY